MNELLPLHVSSDGRKPHIVDTSGKPFQAKGIALSGPFHSENFIWQYRGTESTMRSAVYDVLGLERSTVFFDAMQRSMLRTTDLDFIADLGVNAVRIPVNYHRFVDADHPDGFSAVQTGRLLNIINGLGDRGIYTLIDFHAMPGGQNPDWHSDNATGYADLWEHPGSIARANAFVGHMAESLGDLPHVMGYELMNEPAAGYWKVHAPVFWDSYNAIHQELAATVRAKNSEQILVVCANWFGTQASGIDINDNNLVVAGHVYNKPLLGEEPYPGRGSDGITRDRRYYMDEIERQEIVTYARDHKVPAIISEFGAMRRGDHTGSPARAAGELMSIFNKQELGWFYWVYKGYVMGVVTPSDTSPYSLLTQPEKEKDVYGEDLRERQFKFARQFDLPADEIERVVSESFQLANCTVDQGLVRAFRSNTM